jgi:hypothetical protein
VQPQMKREIKDEEEEARRGSEISYALNLNLFIYFWRT